MNEVLRQEKKYLLNIIEGEKIRGRLEQVMMKDAHNGSRGYRIRSLYFDTLDDSDFYDKIEGIELRRKLRLRIYSPESDFAMLEMKQKEGSYQRKRSLRVSREDAQKLIKGEFSALLHYEDPFAAECFGLFSARGYRAKAIVEYRRRAYIARENKIRVTFDSEITAAESCLDLFSPQLSLNPAMEPFNSVLEVKYNGFLLSYIKELLAMADRSELSVSKYCLARQASLRFSM